MWYIGASKRPSGIGPRCKAGGQVCRYRVRPHDACVETCLNPFLCRCISSRPWKHRYRTNGDPILSESSAPANDAQAAADLVDRICSGDGAAETELWNRYSRGLLFFLRRRTGDSSLAEDLRQDTFRIALEKLRGDGISEPGRLSAYLRGIAANLVSGDWRKRVRQNTTADTQEIERMPDDRSNPADSVSRSEIAGLVRRLIEELGVARDREILRLFYIQEADKDVICTKLGIDATHFNRVMFRARQRFKELLLREERKGKIQLVEN
jgi:RNA polymerase sigma-70 factor (ECF subfamily)